MVAVPLINPVDFASEVLVTAAVLVALIFLWKYRERVMLILTGDDKLHGSVLDCVWCCCCQCCGFCTGEWTRSFTACFCFPRRWRRQNLVKSFGQAIGMSTYSVELRNIIVGDLPYDGRGDVYLSVECTVNPAMMTCVAEDRMGKVIHFPEIITVRVRNCFLEGNVRITAKLMHVFGSEDLCQVVISPMHIYQWASQSDLNDRTKRFQMKTLSTELDRETPAWILVEFGWPMEVRDIDNIKTVDTIRTQTRDRQPQVAEFDVAGYKQKYYLLDPRGNAVDEPLESDMADIRSWRLQAFWFFHFCQCWTLIIAFVYAFFRAYVWSCYRRFNWLTMAVLNNGTMSAAHFPISFHDMAEIGALCEAEVKGTGLEGVPCRPNLEQVNVLCHSAVYLETLHQPWPTAFAGYAEVERILGEGNKVGVPCFPGVCDVRQRLVEHEWQIVGVIVGVFLGNCILRGCSEAWIRNKKASKLVERQRQAQEIRTKKIELDQHQRGSWW